MENLKTIRIEELDRSKYSQDILECLKKGDYNKLYDLPKDDRASYEYMMPLLYAVYNEKGTYAVYTYCAESIQKDTKITEEIIEKEPELLEGTPLSRDEDFIKKHIESKPEIAKYMSPLLRNNPEIITEITNTGNEEAILAIASYIQVKSEIDANPELRNDKEYMLNNMENNGEIIAFASEELKNDYDFLKEAYKKSTVAIDYTAEHTDEFGEKGLTAAKDTIIEHYCDKAIQELNEALEENKSQQEEYRAQGETENADAIKRLEKDAKKLKRHIAFVEKIKNGEKDQVRAAKLIKDICAKIPQEYKKATGQMITIDGAIKQRQQEAEKVVTKGDVGEVATDFEQMQGRPGHEVGELKSALEDPTPEMPKENEDPEQ